jgi:hypothetical protein
MRKLVRDFVARHTLLERAVAHGKTIAIRQKPSLPRRPSANIQTLRITPR